MKNFIIISALLLSFTEVSAQFYFKPDTVHEWEVDTFINAKGRSEMFMYSGTCNTYYNDSVQSRVSVYTDSLGQVLYFGTSFREVGASFFFNKGNNILTSAKVGVYQDKESSLSISTEFPMDEYCIESKESNRKKYKCYENGLLTLEYDKLLVGDEWKTVFYCSYSQYGDIHIYEKLDDQGTGYHLEYYEDGKLFKSCFVANFELLNCPQ